MASRLANQRKRNRGQALVMVTLILFAMVGMMGLAVDLGWSYFTRKSAQAAADAAALATVDQVFSIVGEGFLEGDEGFTYTCGDTAICQAATPCPAALPSQPANAIENGCLYAFRNGFSTRGAGGRQAVSIAADTTSPAPTAPGVNVSYWATATVVQSIPQLFSSILGNTVGVVSARATAGVVDSVVPGSLILLNRERDCLPLEQGNQNTCGVDLLVQANNNQGMDAVRADGGILLASTAHGDGVSGMYAGENQGGGLIRAQFTYIRGAGDHREGGGSQWITDPVNGKPDRGYFKDPMRGKGQPPAPPGNLPNFPIMGGNIVGSDDPNAPALMPPGNYYAVEAQGNQIRASGSPLNISGYVKFTNQGSGFGEWVIFGGLRNQSAGTTVTFEPGRYVFAGVKQTGNNPNPLFDVRVNMTIKDNTAALGPNQDAGEIFIFTDARYPGLTVPLDVQPVADQLVHGISGFQSGNAADIYINIHGLNRANPNVPESLKTFSPVVLWQDQRNSVIKYTPDGNIDTSCGQPECPNTALRSAASTEMFFKASPNLHIYGVAYQPRGAFTSMVGGGGYDSPLQLIAGALRVHANSNVRLQEIDTPLMRRVVSLIE